MWLINAKAKHWLFFILLVVSACAVQKKLAPTPAAERDLSRKIVLSIDSLLKAGDYTKAQKYGRLFIRQYPRSAYLDDVAYRMAYLHIIADAQNPFFDYGKARRAFEKFLEKFPQSQYALACNNWLKVLYLESQLQERNTQMQKELRVLKRELKRKTDEIEHLRNTLKDLEKVIKR